MKNRGVSQYVKRKYLALSAWTINKPAQYKAVLWFELTLVAALVFGTLLEYGWLERKKNLNLESKPYFVPSPEYRIPGIGVGRETMTEADLAKREADMIKSQDFVIMRNPGITEAVKRIKRLQPLFDQASALYGLPKELAPAVGLIESGGDINARSPTGPCGVMQLTALVARSQGLRVPRWRAQCKSAITDDRLNPAKAIPAGVRHLKYLLKKYGREDLALLAYHSGEPEADSLLRKGRAAFPGEVLTMAKLFFGNHPGWNRSLYRKVRYLNTPKTDFGVRYPFKVERAKYILGLYDFNPAAFTALKEFYSDKTYPKRAAPYLHWAWYDEEDLAYWTYADIDPDSKSGKRGKGLVPVFDDPEHFGVKIRRENGVGASDLANQAKYCQNGPAASGLLYYLGFLMNEAKNEAGVPFKPLDLTSLIRHGEYQGKLPEKNAKTGFPSHLTGQVFDVAYTHMTSLEREWFKFILNDLGYARQLGYAPETTGSTTYHITVSPSKASQDFFTQVYNEALKIHLVREKARRKAAERSKK